MKHLKAYEELNIYSPFILQPLSCWSIKGDNEYITSVYNKLIDQLKYKKDKELFEKTTLLHSLRNEYKDAIGVYLYFEDQGVNKGISYYVLREYREYDMNINEQEKCARDIAESSDLIYRGELKLINDKVVIDTLQIDAEKYNL